MKEPENRNRLKRVSFFTRPVFAESAKQGRLAVPENGRSMTGSRDDETEQQNGGFRKSCLRPQLKKAAGVI